MSNNNVIKLFFNKMIWILTVVMLSSQIIFSAYSWVNIIFIFSGVLIFVLDNISNKGSILPFGRMQKSYAIFIIYGFLTSIWSLDPKISVGLSITLTYVIISITLIEPHYLRYNDLEKLKSVIIWSGIIIALYTVYSFGINGLIESSKSYHTRILSTFDNVNTISMFCAFGVLLQFESWIYNKKFRLSLLFLPVSLFVVACLQSRKAITILFLGCLFLLIFKNYSSRNLIISLFKIILSIAIILWFFYTVINLEIFSGLHERLNGMFALLGDQYNIDSSSMTRQAMFKTGIHIWKNNLIQGIGLGTSHIMVMKYLGINTYLHNNYIELLSSTGLLGFIFYYSMHIYILISLIKYRNNDKQIFDLGLMWILLTLIIDFGLVSYYGRVEIFYLMCQFINLNLLIKKGKDNNEIKKNLS